MLSGGSAHGLAHIGVLKILEEEGVHVDYITGTSMGSIIGGLYALGMTADEIHKLTERQDWDAIISTSVPLRDIAPSEKPYHNRYGLTVEVRNGGVKFPDGFLNSQNLDLQLNRMFADAHEVRDFDSLPIPFRCIAVDIVKGEVAVLKHGYLGRAVRASMAIPSVFAPVEIDGQLLVDGGLIRNFPVQEARDMGADIIIGVYVGSELEKREDLNDLLDILSQSAFMMGILDSREQKKNVDILMEPDVKSLPSFGFDLNNVLIREGYNTAAAQRRAIRRIAAEQKGYDIKKHKPLESVKNLKLTNTEFPFIRSPYDALANFKYGAKSRGNVSFDQIEAGISRIFGTKHFEQVNYTFQSNQYDRKQLAILAQPRKVNSISASLNFMPSTSTALILTNESRNLISQPSVLYTTLRLAENYGARIDYNYRLGRKKDFLLRLLGQIHKAEQYLYAGEDLRKQYTETNALAQIGVGYEPNNRLLLKLSGGVAGLRLKPIGQDGGLETFQRFDLKFQSSAEYNSLNLLAFPTTGFKVEAGLAFNGMLSNTITFGSDPNLNAPEEGSFGLAYLKSYGVQELTQGIAVEFGIEAAFKSNTSLSNNFKVGGFENRDPLSYSMIGLNTHQFQFDRMGKGYGALRINLSKALVFSLRADYIEGRRAFIPADQELLSNEAIFSFGGLISYKSPIGPIQFALGRNDLTETWTSNFNVGYTFF